MIKIIAIIESTIGTGGGFDQALNAIMQMKRLSSNRFEFNVFTTQESNISVLTQLGIQAENTKITFCDRLLVRFSKSRFWRSLLGFFQLIGPLERKLITASCDLVYFVTPGNLSAALNKLNYITTLWDLCHRETPEFPEMRNFKKFLIREEKYKNNFGPAVITITESQRLSDMASEYYGVESNRFLAMPLTPSQFLSEGNSVNAKEILIKYRLEANYLFYPAQFWGHKNHIRILQALIILRNENGWKPTVVFSGKDYGNLEYINEFIENNMLKSQVKIIGFVPSEDMRGLYQNAMVVIMPTYFGPTNLPPLEAWSLGVPLIYSAQLAEQAGNAALLVDPDDAAELAAAMLHSRKQEVQEQLICAGYDRLEAIAEQRKSAETKLCAVIHKFAMRRECWR